MKKLLYFTLAFILVTGASAGFAQSPADSAFTVNKGFSSDVNFTGNHDSISGWSSILDSSVSYDFNSVFGMQLGVPYYMTHNGYDSTVVVKGNASAPLITSYNSLGDVYLDLNFSAPKFLGYKATIAGTAPTGDT